MDIGRDVMVDSYTQYLQQVRKTKTGFTDFLWQETSHTFNYRAEGQEDMEETSQIQ